MTLHPPLRRRLITFAIVTTCLVGIFIEADAQTSPAIKFYVGDTEVDATKGVAAKDLPQLSIRVVPNDMKYELAAWSLYLRRGTQLGSPVRGSGESLNLQTAMFQPGDVISIEIRGVTRTDANGKKENVALTTEMKYVSIAILK